MNLDHLKKQARNLQRTLSNELSRDVALSTAQEWTARMHGYPDWHAATAAAQRVTQQSASSVSTLPKAPEKLVVDVAGLGVTLDRARALELHAAVTRYLGTGQCERDVAQLQSTHAEGIAAARRLLDIARSDTGQARKVADFLLAWHNAEQNGGWDPFLIASVDAAISRDMLRVLAMVRNAQVYPSSKQIGLRDEIDAVWELWRGRRSA